jgi:hypothetical protein
LLLASVIVKVAVPVGVPEPGLSAATDAVNTVSWPLTGLMGLEDTVVVVKSGFTVWLRALEVDP